MPKPSRYTDRFAQLQQHYEATEPKWLVKRREGAKAIAEVMAALGPPPKLSFTDEELLAWLLGGQVRIHGTLQAAFAFPYHSGSIFNGYSRSPTGRVRK